MQYFSALRMINAILIGILLVKTNISLKDISIYELIFFLANFLSFSWSIAFKNSFLARYHQGSKSEQRSYYFNFYLIYLGFSLLAAFVFLIIAGAFDQYLLSVDIPFHFVGLMILFLLLNTPAVLVEHIFLLERQANKIFRYANVIFLIQLAMLLAVFLIEPSILNVVIVMCVWAALKAVYLWILLIQKSKFQPSKFLLRSYLLLTAPLIAQSFMGGSMDYLDGFLVTSFFDTDQFAIYRYGARELPLISILITSLVSALIPLASQNMDAGLTQLRERLNRLMHWIFPIGILLILMSPMIFTAVYSEVFRESAFIFNVYLLILVVRFVNPQLLLYAKKLNRELMYASMIESMVNLVLSLLLLKYLGIIGIALASFLSFSVHKTVMLYYSRKRLNIGLSSMINIRWFTGYTTLIVVAFFASLWMYS